MIQIAQLPFLVSIQQIQNEVLLLSNEWRPHFNRKHYEGGWTVLSLRSPAGEAEQIIPDIREEQEYADTILMDHCPAIKKLLEELRCPKMAVRLMNLMPGAVIKEHRDHDLAYEKGEARLHFPVFTNPHVAFHVNGEKVKMVEGECWYVNVNLPHKVANNGVSDRIHLVVDVVVNEWVKSLFAQGQVVEVVLNPQDDQTGNIIRELRIQNTETTNRLADDLERKLNTTGM